MPKLARKLLVTTLTILSSYSFAWGNRGQQAAVATAQHYATDVGAYILNSGGTAVDAAVAMGYALAVVHPSCGNLGGGGFMLVDWHGKLIALDFREKAPQKLSTAAWLRAKGVKRDALNVGVPGSVAGLNKAHALYGKLPLAFDIQPAIYLAQHGYALNKGDAFFIGQGYKNHKFNNSSRPNFFHNGHALVVGDVIKQPQLAKTLQAIATKGDAAFYRGKLARRIVNYVDNKGGVLSLSDMARYKVKVQQPLTCSYHGNVVYTAQPPSKGGYVLCRILQSMNNVPATHKYYNPTWLRANILAMRNANRQAKFAIADPRYMTRTAQSLLQQHRRSYAKANLIRREGFNTTSLVAEDKYGNAVAMIYSLNAFFGSGLMAPDTGVFLNNQMQDFYVAKSGTKTTILGRMRPGAAPVSSMAPTMVFRDGQLALVAGTPGGGTIPSQLSQLIESLFTYKKSLKNALKETRYYISSKGTLYIENSGDSKVQQQLKNLGYPYHMGSIYGYPVWGGVTALWRKSNGRWVAAIDPRRPSGAAKVLR